MLIEDILIDDLVHAKWNSIMLRWEYPDSKDGNLVSLVVIQEPKKGQVCYFLCCESDCVGAFFEIEEGHHLDKKWLGQSACIIVPSKVVAVVDRPKKIGDKVNLSCSMYQGSLTKMNQPNHTGSVIKEFAIIGRRFNQAHWQYEYAVAIPSNAATGVRISEEDIVVYDMDPSLKGSLFQGVLTSEIPLALPTPVKIGMSCFNQNCKVYCEWVDQPNCPNDVFLCYGCRSNPVTYYTVMDLYEKKESQ